MAEARESILLGSKNPRRQEGASAPIPEGSRIGNIVCSSLLHAIDFDIHDMTRTDPDEQAKLLFEAIGVFMETAGGTPDNIVQLTVYLREEKHRASINKEWLKMFPDPSSRPGRIVVYRDFHGSNLCFEVSLIAVL